MDVMCCIYIYVHNNTIEYTFIKYTSSAFKPAAKQSRFYSKTATYIPMAASTLSLMTQSIDRYSSIKHPRHNRLHRDKHPAYLVSGVVAAWTVAVVVSVPRYAWPVHRLMADMRWTRYYETCYVAVVFAVPWAAVAFSQRAVSRTLYITSLKAAAARGQLPLPMPIMTAECKQVILVASIQKNTTVQSKVANDVAVQQQPQQQPHSSHQQTQHEQQQLQAQQQQQQKQKQRPTPSARSRKRLAKVLVALAGVFVVCWLPYAAALLYTNWFYSSPQDGNEDDGGGGKGRPAIHRLATVAAMLLGHAHSAVNPVAYWWLNRHTLRACPWCCSSGDQFDDDDDDEDDGAGFGCGPLGCIVNGAAMAFGCGRGDGSCGGGGAVDCAGGTGCRQSQNHTPTRLNRLLFHRQPNNHQRSRQPSSTNEAALGPFNPRFATPKKRPQQLPVVKNPVMLYYA
ncbi:annetocin receptor isoform X1 [Rhopalosiphum padi]|uniref:annetocin receptor isoform X1 n=2 Tax=Rhopalosiphum padi TaxID=40932 RepID=UPI00298DF620|nr:annetocin receptor isoform X1 [Rhopalosiphum padi]